MERNTMKIRTRMLALVLVLSFLLGLCGCLPVPTVQKGETAPEEELQTSEAGLSAREEAIETLAGDGYFTPLAREALSFDEMVLGEISLDEFTPYAQALTRAAEAESREAFHRACVEAERMLVRINTAGALLEIESDRDATDEARSTRADNQVQAYYDAMDLYDRTLCEIASGDHAGMLDKEFAAWQIEYFRSYDAESSAQSLYLTNQEAQLVSQYALCSSQDEVDYERLTEIYLQLVSVRAEMAELAGAANYSEYAYSAFYSRDYTPSDAQKIWKTAKEDFAPLLQKYTDSLTQALWKEDLSAGECTEESIVQALCYGAAVFQITLFLRREKIVVACGRHDQRFHAQLHTRFQIDIRIEVEVRPEVDELDFIVAAANAVDPPEPLHQPHRVPVNVIVDQAIAVLQILTL